MRLCALHTGCETYLDHLGVLSILLDIPLIVTEPETFRLAQIFYPQLKCFLKSPLDLSLEFLAINYDGLMTSGHYLAAEMTPLFDLLFGKKMRMIYCPHGNSDKGYSFKETPPKDITLVYGHHMLDLLKKTKALDRISTYIITGNFRSYFYLTHKPFYDQLIQTLLFPYLNKKKKTLLYAPTWSDKENISSFFTCCEKIIENLGPRFNLIIKLHPFLKEQALAYTSYLKDKFEDKKNIIFLSDCPAIYPLLEHCDGYLGDFSSIGYDMLFFEKPMFFFGSHCGPIYQCGQEIPLKADILKFIESNWEWNKNYFKSNRKDVYKYAFGTEFSKGKIEKEIKRALYSYRALSEKIS